MTFRCIQIQVYNVQGTMKHLHIHVNAMQEGCFKRDRTVYIRNDWLDMQFMNTGVDWFGLASEQFNNSVALV